MDEFLYQDLVKKVRLQRGLHRYYELRTRFTATFVKIIDIVLPAHIVFLVFSDLTSLSSYLKWLTPVTIELLIGASGFILFVTSVLTEVFKGDSRHLDHRKAIERYTELLQEIQLTEAKAKAGRTRAEMFESFNKRYLQITVTSPTFTDKQFERAMVYLLRSKAVKSARKENPFAPFWQVPRIARSKVAEILEDPSDPLYGFPLFKRERRQEEQPVE